MSENVKSRSRGSARGNGVPVTEAPVTGDPDSPTELAGTDVAQTTATDQAADDQVEVIAVPEIASDGGSESVAGRVIGWADAVPWLALRWGSAPTAAEVRFAPVVWRMLQELPGRTALQMAAEAELSGHFDLDPTVLARVLARYEKAGVARSVTNGRLAWWSVVDPAEIISDAQESVRASASAPTGGVRAGRAVGMARTTSGGAVVTPAGGLRGLVEDHLADNPFEDFSPSQVAKALGGRSSGAVANALERLVEIGAAIQTSMSPRRYQHRPDADAAPSTDPDTAADTADDTDEAIVAVDATA